MSCHKASTGDTNDTHDTTDSADTACNKPWYADADADGYGDPDHSEIACVAPQGFVADATDCDDASADVHPGADETCDAIDDDCDGTVDVGAIDEATWYADLDKDGYGDDAATLSACDAPDGYVAQGGDCDDADDAFHPGADEPDCTDPNDYNCDGSTGFADADGDGAAACVDCDDADPTVNPTAIETCDGKDDDCDGETDEPDASDASTWYADTDGDGYGDATVTTVACSAPAGYVATGDDCNDADKAYNPGATEADCTDPNDYNCDGSVGYADKDGDGFAACADCDDSDAAVNSGAVEVCNGKDDDCDATTDEADAADATDWYADADGDSFGDAATTEHACAAPTGYVADDTDCDDTLDTTFPGADETCNGTDDDCNGTVDDAYATDAPTWYADTDGDGYGDLSKSLVQCDQPSGYVLSSSDCDDASASVHPTAAETCNGTDDDCNGTVDDDYATDASTWYVDADTDGYGDAATTALSCSQPAGYVTDATDCDDASADVFPGADEYCDGVDDDCNGTTDDDYALDAGVWFEDSDADGYGNPEMTASACAAPTGYVTDDTDCDDVTDTVHPSADEYCDGVDDDCNGTTDDDYAKDASTWYADGDGDGYGSTTSAAACSKPTGYVATNDDCDDAVAAVNPGATEVCDSKDTDEDCDGKADNADLPATGMTSYFSDADGDGYGTGVGIFLCDPTSSNSTTDATDCNDSDSAVHPGATEVCDASNTDEDCNGQADDADAAATGKSTYYADADGDGYGAGSGTSLCDAVSGMVATNGDCDDVKAAVNPGATEVCDASNTDEDCDGAADDADSSATGQSTYYTDADGDGYGTGTGTSLCDASGTTSATTDGDCDDAHDTAYPGGTEIAGDGIDQDCSGADLSMVGYAHTQYPCSISTYTDVSNTVYGWVYMSGVTDSSGQGVGITAEAGFGPTGTDPSTSSSWTWSTGTYNGDKDGLTPGDVANDEYQATIAPTATGTFDYGWRFSTDGGSTWVYGDLGSGCGGSGSSDGWNDAGAMTVADGDADGDGYNGTATGGGDCDDTSVYVYPGAPELCDGKVNDCTTSGSWTSASENGKASTESSTGTWADVTTSVSGTSSTAKTYTPAADTTVWFCDGTFYTRLTISKSNVTVRGRSGAATTILDGAAGGTVITVSSSPVTIQDVTVQNGYASKGGGLSINVSGGTVTLTDDTIGNNTATSAGGGIYVNNGTVNATGTDVTNNKSQQNGGGIYQVSGGVSAVTFSGSTISGNSTSASSNPTGGGWFIQGATASGTLTSSSYLEGNSVTTTGTGSTFGGGVSLQTGATFSCTDSSILSNVASVPSPTTSVYGKGGGAYMNTSGTITLKSNNCDWGTSSTDNTPSDILLNTSTAYTYSAGSAATFTCINSGSSPYCK